MPRHSERQPSPFGRFLFARRRHAIKYRKDNYPTYIREALRSVGSHLTQEDVAIIGTACMKHEIHKNYQKLKYGIDKNDVLNAEKSTVNVPNVKLYWILRGVLLSKEECEELMENIPFLRGVDSGQIGNGHLLQGVRAKYKIGEFGNHINNAMQIGEGITSWVSLAKSSDCSGFRPEQFNLVLDRSRHCLRNDEERHSFAELTRRADTLTRTWSDRRDRGKEAPSDNDTIALQSISISNLNDAVETEVINGSFLMSRYAYNKVVKDKEAADFRWEELQYIESLSEPTPVLTSGIGVALNVLCEGGQTAVVGVRSSSETFRKHERDVAVVESIRPSANVDVDSRIDIYGVLRRALEEELGFNLSKRELNIEYESMLKRSIIFEVGVDLEYYQYNFLGLVVTDFTFEQIVTLWKKAKDRKETKWLERLQFNRDSAMQFVSDHQIWGSGMACLLHSFDYITPAYD